VYDIDDDGVLQAGELLQVLKLMVGSNLTDADLAEITSRTMAALRKSDTSSGGVTWEEFYLAMSSVDVRRLMSLVPECGSPICDL